MLQRRVGGRRSETHQKQVTSLAIHQKSSHGQRLHALQKLEGKGGFDHESQAEVAHGSWEWQRPRVSGCVLGAECHWGMDGRPGITPHSPWWFSPRAGVWITWC